MSDAQEPKVSSLSRTVKCQGQLLHVDIYEDGEGGWCLAVTNEQRVTSNWAESFKTERAALRAAMKTIKEEGPEGFGMEQPYKDALQ